MRKTWLDCRNYEIGKYLFSSTSPTDLARGLLFTDSYLPQGKIYIFSTHIINIYILLLWLCPYLIWNIHKSIHWFLGVILLNPWSKFRCSYQGSSLILIYFFKKKRSGLFFFLPVNVSKNQEFLLELWSATYETNSRFSSMLHVCQILLCHC